MSSWIEMFGVRPGTLRIDEPVVNLKVSEILVSGVRFSLCNNKGPLLFVTVIAFIFMDNVPGQSRIKYVRIALCDFTFAPGALMNVIGNFDVPL